MDEIFETFTPSSLESWREWLLENHDKAKSIWLIYHKKGSNKPSVKYSDAVDEALCFGWIDSTSKPIDEHTYRQYFCKRKPTSVWSRVNKLKVERLISEDKMTKAGFESIEIAKQNGSWYILDEVEDLIIPLDLKEEFEKYPLSLDFFLGLSRTDKRNILQWLVLAKRPETKKARIDAIVTLAQQGQKPKQF